MELQLSEIRIKIDQHDERIVSGIKDRSRYPLNLGVFQEKFAEGKTWFEYRLIKEQSLDAEFGRYEFEDQQPVLLSKDQLPKPKVRRSSPNLGLVITGLDNSLRVISMYRRILDRICKNGEDINSYGETVKIDVGNILELYERILLGREVAEAKLQACPSLQYMEPEIIRNHLINKKREQEVIDKGITLARNYQIANPEAIGELFRDIIEVTLDLEVDYILQARKKEDSKPKARMGFGTEVRNTGNGSKGFGIP